MLFEVNWRGKQKEFLDFDDALNFLYSTECVGDIWQNKNGEYQLIVHRGEKSYGRFYTVFNPEMIR